MALVKEQLGTIGEYLTLNVAAQLKGTTPDNLRHWLRIHQIKTNRVGTIILVRLQDIEGYTPREKRILKDYNA